MLIGYARVPTNDQNLDLQRDAMLGTMPAEVGALLRQTLDPDRARELRAQPLATGLPV